MRMRTEDLLKMMGGDAEKIMRAAGGDMSALPALLQAMRGDRGEKRESAKVKPPAEAEDLTLHERFFPE